MRYAEHRIISITEADGPTAASRRSSEPKGPAWNTTSAFDPTIPRARSSASRAAYARSPRSKSDRRCPPRSGRSPRPASSHPASVISNAIASHFPTCRPGRKTVARCRPREPRLYRDDSSPNAASEDVEPGARRPKAFGPPGGPRRSTGFLDDRSFARGTGLETNVHRRVNGIICRTPVSTRKERPWWDSQRSGPIVRASVCRCDPRKPSYREPVNPLPSRMIRA